jgi:RNA polymerase sigma factor (TIGR02999 family)
MAEVTQDDPDRLLEQWRSGDEEARSRLLELLHDHMRSIARRLMRSERSNHTLQPTAVVNEACVRLLGVNASPATTGAQFLGFAAHVMRQVLVDHARARGADRRGGDWQRVSVDLVGATDDQSSDLLDALDLDAALQRLAALSPRQAHVAELRYFGGLSISEAAEVLGVSVATVKNEWAVARAWLHRELDSGKDPGPTV